MIWTLFNFRTTLLDLAVWLLLAGTMAKAEPPKLILPTENDGLLTGKFAEFYQYVQRDFEGQISQPWEGGQYGFVRNPRRIGSQVIYTRFHEGIDIRPLHRDATGEPQDIIHSIAAGTVVYTNPVAGNSNYGRYVVIEHHLDGFPYYSLYAHLKTITANVGDLVSQGSPIAVMGHTGEGLDRERAHVHLELNLLLNSHFSEWFQGHHAADIDRHGIYNGINLAGIDIGRFYLELQKNPELTVAAFVQQGEPWYRVLVPISPRMDLTDRYPWLLEGETDTPSCEISFDRTGLPLKVHGSSEHVAQPTVTWVHSSPFPQHLLTKGFIRNRGSDYVLSEEGSQYISLVCDSPEARHQ
jgi:murein DD-endopeptidase MepM/ murein hydrolase activator NlpD